MEQKKHASKLVGEMSECEKHAHICHWGCCKDIGMKGGMYFMPNEFDGKDVNIIDHLKVKVKFASGGGVAICTAKNAATCDGKYKPHECALFPIFPKYAKDEILIYTFHDPNEKNKYCPIQGEKHAIHLQAMFKDILRWSVNEKARDFFNSRALNKNYKLTFKFKRKLK